MAITTTRTTNIVPGRGAAPPAGRGLHPAPVQGTDREPAPQDGTAACPVDGVPVQAVDLWKTYRLPGEDVHALRGVNLTIAEGEFVALMGDSGAGKTTLLDMIGCLDCPSAGQLLICGEDTSRVPERRLYQVRRRTFGFVFQDFLLLPYLTARENVELGRQYGDRSRAMTAHEALDQVGLLERARHYPHELSGGEQQRVAIARAVVKRPRVLVADEPTGHLDSANSRHVMETLGELHATGITVVVVTHSPEMAAFAGRVVLMRDGQVVDEDVRLQTS